MKKIWLVALVSGTLLENYRTIKEEFQAPLDKADELIKVEYAKPKTDKDKKEYEEYVLSEKSRRAQEAEKEAQAAALLEEEQLKQTAREKAEELYDLLEKVALVDPNFSDEILEIFGCIDEDEKGKDETGSNNSTDK